MPGAFDLDPLLAPLPATPPLGLGAPVLKPLPPPPSWRDAALASLEQPASSKAPSWRDAALASLEPVEQLNVVGSPPVPPPLPPLAQKPDLTQPGILPNETAPQHLARLNELHANEGFVGGVKELGRSVARGVRNLPETVQESGQFFGRALGLAPPATADELARLDAEKTARAEAAPDWMKESLTSQAQEHPWGSLAEAGESLVPSLGPAATGAAIGAGLTAWTGPGAAVGAIGGAAIGGVLGILGMSGQQGEETYRKVTDANIKAGLSPEDAHEAGMHAGLINASIEGAGEVVSTLLLAKAGALIPPSLKLGVTSAIAKRLGMAGADASADVVQRAATNQGAILRAAKDIAFQVAPAEIATEMGQQAGEQGVESLYGAGAMPTWDDAKRVVVPTLVMTAFGAGGAHAFGAYRRSEANRLLTDPAAGTPQERQAVVDTVARSVQQEDPELARIFRAYASASVAANLPVAIDQDAAYREVAARAAVANPTLTDAQAKQAAVDATAAETDPQDLQRVAAATAAALANRPKTGPLTRAAQTAGPPNVSQNAVQQAAGAGQAGPPAGQAVGGGARPVPPAGPAPGAASGTNVGVAAVRGADGAAVQPGALRPGSGVDDLGYPTEGAGRTPGPSGPQGGPSGLGGMDPNAGLTTAPGPLTLQGQDEARAAGALYGSNVGAVLPGAGTKQTGKGYDPKVPPGSPIADPAVRKRLDDWWTNINEPAPTQPTPTEDPNAPSSPPPSPTPTPEVKPPRDTGAAPGAPDTPAADQGKEPTKEENGRRYQVGAKSLTARELAGRLAEFRTESVDDLERSVRARPGPWIKVLEDREASARLDKDAEQKARPVALNEKQRRLVDQAREWNTRFFDPRNPLERALPHPEDTADKQRMMRHLVNLGVVSRYVDQETGVIGWQVQDQRIAPAADQGETPAAKGGGTPAPMPTGFKVRNLRTGRFLKDGITGKDAVLQDRDHAQKVADDSERDSHLNAKATNSIRPSKFAVVDLSDEVTAPEPPTTGTKPTPALSPKAQAARDAGYADGLAGKPEPAASLVPRRQGWKEGKAARDAAGATTVETPVVTQPTPTVKELTPEPTTPAPTDKESLTVAARSYDDWLKAFSSDVAAGRLPDTAPLNDLRNRHIKEAARLLEGVANVTGYDAEDGRFITDDQGHFQTVGAIDERRAAAARVQPQIAQLRHELASGYSALRDARASQSHAKLVERQQQEADQRREDQKKAREEQKARDEAERRKPVPPSAREIELNDLETKVRARLADLRRQGRERRDAGESNEALTTEYQPQISEGQQHLKWIAEHGFDRFHQGQLVSSTYIGAKYGEIPQDLIDFANSAPTPAPEGAAAGAKAQKPKLPNKQRAAQQKVASVMGAAPGDTVTFSDFASGQMDYLSPDKPYVLESVTARGYGDAELHFVSATGSGTSVALARIVAAQRQVGATWQVAKKVSAQPDAGPDGATPAAPEPAAAATPATPEPPTAKTPAAKTPAEAAPAQPPEQPQPAPAYGASNTLVTADRAAELRKRLKAKLSQLNAGIDPEILAIGAELAAFHLEAGARSFAAFAKRIAEDLGEPLPKLRPYLRSWYNGARDMMEDAGISIDGMDDPQTVKAELARIFTQQPATLTAEPQPEPTNGPPTDTPDQAGERPDRRDGLADRGPEGTGDDRPVAADSPADGGTIGTGGDFGGVRAPDREPPVRGERGEPESGDGLAGQSGGSEQGLVDRGPGRPRGSKRPGRGPNAAAGDGGTGAGAAVGAGAGAEDQTGAGGTVEPVTPDEPSTTLDLAARAENFHADEPERIYGGTPKVRFNKNRRAIEVYRELEEAGRNATADERDILAGYTGWGSFGQELFQGTWERTVEREGWRNEDDWLRGHLGESEWKAAQASIINAHYTDPPTVQAIWAAVQRLGFQGGRVLEPAAGVGNFFAMMPKAVQDASQLTGIELDELSSGILKHLYPNATISNKPYQESQTPDGFYDLVIGNWPFASTGPADRRYNKLSPSLHDYFFLKALDQVRAGGLVVGITSRYSLDGKGNAVRQALARKADLVAAYRLPSGAFKEYAGTAVVTDLIILKKRETENTDPQSSAWTQTEDLDLGADGQKAAINRYYLLNRDNILGELGWGSGTTYGRAGVIVERGDDFPERLAAMADEMTTGTYTPANNAKHIRYITNNTTERSRAVVIGADGDLYQTQGERLVNLHDVVPWQVKDAKKTAKRDAQLRGLVGLRKAYGRLIDAERDGAPDTEALRKTLREQYEAFRDAHGPVRESEGIRLLDKAEDPFYPSLMALERVRDGVIEPMPILHRSVVRTSAKIDRPTVRDAYVVERNQGLHIDMARIATAAGVPVEQAEQDLVTAGAVYRLPGGGYEPSDVYLGGNVRRKLREAQAAAEQGEEMARNIEHLEKVIPKDVPYFNIEAKLGAQWVGAKHYRDFVAEVIIGNADVAENLELEWRINRWVVKPSDAHQDTPTALRWSEVKAFEEVTTKDAATGKDVPLLDGEGKPVLRERDSGTVRLRQLLEAAFNNGTMKFTAKDSEGNTYTREAFSAAANERAGAIREAFEEWVWKSPERKVALERDYNEVMNAIADPQFDGSFLAFDGMALQRGDNEFDLRSHQSNAIWRGLVQGSGLYAHEVGTGKTYTIGGISVESRRFGLAQKPLILAHNANSASVAAEIQEMYPGAKVLYVNNLDSSRVKETMAQIRNDDWDAVVMPHSLLDRLTLKKETLSALAAEDIAALESAFWEAMDEGDANQAGFGRAVHKDMLDDEDAIKKLRNPTAKELAQARLRIKAQIEKQAQQSSREDAIAFEDLGVDMLIVDEAHLFKKPPMATRMKMRGLQKQISNRSVALKFLTDYIKGQHAGRGVHLFTGTPITNTLAEIFHMQRYVMQQDMARDGIDQWDSWFNTFASGVSDVEFTAAGDYQPVTKLAGFINVAELRRMMSPYMDVVFADEMPEFTPRKTASGKTLADADLTADEIDALQNGRQENPVGRPYKRVVMDVAEMSPEQAAILARLQQLAAEWRSAGGKQRLDWMKTGDPHSPIMIEGAAARAGMDARMEDLSLPEHPESKVNRAVRNLLHHYRGEPQAAQVVFMDKGYSDTRTVAKVKVPGHNLAKELRTKLLAEGVPAHEIAIVAGGVTPEQKKAVADAVNAGTVRIVIGQTETLGTGVNMQQRLRAMHHLDAPWMPGELEQRNGRGWRQGNTWNTVLEYRYITERIDGKRWQVLAVKDRFIKAFLHADADTRVIEGDAVSDDEGGGYAETLSEAVGDPRLLQRQKLTVDVQKLQRRERTHAQGVVEAREKLARNERLVPEKEAQAKRYDADADLFEQAEAAAGERQQDAYREEVAVYVDGLDLNLTAAERAAVRADGWGNKQPDRELAKRVQAAVKAAEAEGRERPKEPTTKPFDARLLNDHFTTRDAFGEAFQTLYQRMPVKSGWHPVGEVFGFPLEGRHVGKENVYLQLVSLTDSVVHYGVYGAVADTLRGLRGTGRQVRAEAATLRADRPKLEELADQPFARAKDLERKQTRLDEIEADMARNPVPAPAWLRHGAPVDTLAYVLQLNPETPDHGGMAGAGTGGASVTTKPIQSRGPQTKEVVVEGHQWADDGYFVHVLDGERARRVSYLDLRDANGERKYTEHPFVAPSGANVAAADALPAGVWVVEWENKPPQAPRWINIEDLAQLKAHGATVRRAAADDWQALSLWERMNRPTGIGEQVLEGLGATAKAQRARSDAAQRGDAPEPRWSIGGTLGRATQTRPRSAALPRLTRAFLDAKLQPLFGKLRGLSGAATLRVVQTEGDLPAATLEGLARARSVDPTARGKAVFLAGPKDAEGNPTKGVLWVVADNVADVRDAMVTVLAHEGWHSGARSVFGPTLNPFLDELIKDRNADVQLYADARGLSMESLAQRREAADEFLAHLAEVNHGKDQPFLLRVYNAIRAFLRKLGLVIHLNNADLREIVAGVAQYNRTGDDRVRAQLRGRFGMGTGTRDANARLATGRGQAEPSGDSGRLDESADPDIRFAIGGAGVAPGATRTLASRIADVLDRFMPYGAGIPGRQTSAKVRAWDKSVGTPRNLSIREPQFKPVYDGLTRQSDDNSTFAMQAESLAPHWFTQMEKGMGAAWASAKQVRSAMSPRELHGVQTDLNEGTLNKHRWSVAELKARGRSDRQIESYNQALKATHQSLDTSAQTFQVGAMRSLLEVLHADLPKRERHALSGRLARQIMDEHVTAAAGNAEQVLSAIREDVAEAVVTAQNMVKTMTAERDADEQALDAAKKATRAAQQALDAAGKADYPSAYAALQRAQEAQDDAQSGLHQSRKNLEAAELGFEQATTLRNKIDSTQASIDGIAEKVEKLKAEGYFPLKRFGKWAVTVWQTDPDTNERAVIYFAKYASEAEQMAAYKAMSEAKGAGQEVVHGITSEEGYKLFRGLNMDTLSLFADHMDTSTDDGKNLADLMQEYIRLAAAESSALKSLLHREGIAGYSTEAQRVLASYIVSNARLSSNNLNAGDVGYAIDAIKQENGDLRTYAINLRDYLADPNEEFAGLRQFLFAWYLGASVASAVTNLSQVPMVTAPWMTQQPGNVTQLLKDAYAQVFKGPPATGTALGDAYARAELEGLIAPQGVYNLMATARGGTLGGGRIMSSPNAQFAMTVWGSFFSLAEQVNRQVTFVAAYRQAEGNGLKGEAAFKYAEDGVNSTQFVMRKENRPPWARGIGAPLFTFRMFSVQYMELLSRVPTKQRALMLAALVVGAGLGGLPGEEDAEDLIDTIMQWWGKNWQTRQELNTWAEKLLGEAIGPVVVNGISRAGLPFDIASRVGMGNLIPATGILKPSSLGSTREVSELWGPTAGVVKDVGTAVEQAARGQWDRAGYALLPRALKGFVDGTTAMVSGDAVDRFGTPLIPVSRTEAAFKFLGFNPTRVAQFNEQKYSILERDSLRKKMEQTYMGNMAQAAVKRDQAGVAKAQRDIADWNRTNPDTPIEWKPAQLRARIRALKLTNSERFLKALSPELRQEAAAAFGG
jgi:N12 class adenine-specific DNA methylase